MVYNSYREYRVAWEHSPNSRPQIPLNIDLELTTVCNLQCPFCFHSTPKFKKLPKNAYIEDTLAFHLIRQARELGIPSIKFNWRGESTLHPNFNQIMIFANKHGKFYERLINTNGNVPDGKIIGLMQATKVMISLDTYGEQNYARMRKNGSLKTVLNTINRLLDRGHKNIWVRRVITEENRNEDFVDLTRSLFGGLVHIAEHYCFDRGNPQQMSYPRTYCGYPSQRLVIATNGDVYPCCVDYYGTMKVGNVYNQMIKSIWHSEKMRYIVSMLKNNLMPSKTCEKCTSFMAYKCKERDNVSDKDLK